MPSLSPFGEERGESFILMDDYGNEIICLLIRRLSPRKYEFRIGEFLHARRNDVKLDAGCKEAIFSLIKGLPLCNATPLLPRKCFDLHFFHYLFTVPVNSPFAQNHSPCNLFG